MCVPPLAHRGLSRRGLLAAAAPLGAAAAIAGGTPAVASARAPFSAPGPDAGVLPTTPTPAQGDRLTFLGTLGGPPPEVGVAGVSTVLTVDGKNYVVDAGRSSVTQYVNAGLRMADLSSIFVTHLHADHVADLYNYVNLAAFGVNDANDGVTEPFTILGPSSAGALPATDKDVPTVNPANPVPGISDYMDSMRAANAYSHNLFIRDSGVPDPASLVTVQEITPPAAAGSSAHDTAPRMSPFEVFRDERITVTGTLVPHGPVYPAYAFRFDTPRHSVVFSGDTSYSENLIELARGADVLVHEVIDLSFYAQIGLTGALLDHLKESHTDLTEVGAVAEQAGVGTLALTHLVPGLPGARTMEQWRAGAQQGFSGAVVVGSDLGVLPL